MSDLKTFLDAANAASDKVKAIKNEIETAFALNTDEGTNQALALRPKLEEAVAKANAADALYRTMRDASMLNVNEAPKFTPKSNDDPDKEKSKSKVMKRSEFDALDHPQRYQFMAAGGKTVDD